MKQHLWNATVRLTGKVDHETLTVATAEKDISLAATKAMEKAINEFPETTTDVIEVKYAFTLEQ